MKKSIQIISLCSVLMACGGGGGSSDKDPIIDPPVVKKTKEQAMAELLTSQAEHYIIPAYRGLLEQSTQFEQASANFCSLSTPTQDDLESLRGAWFSLSQDWQYSRAIKMGPVSEEFRHFRLQYWPDNNNAVSRGVASLLASAEINQFTVASLQDGAQGIPALEYLLYFENNGALLLSGDEREKRCLAVMAIAANVHDIIADVVQLWTEGSDPFFASFTQGSGDYTTQQAVLEDFVTNWFELIEVISDNKINHVLGFEAPGRINDAEQNLSQTSLNNIKQNFKGIEAAYYVGTHYGFDNYLNEIHEGHQVGTKIDQSFIDINAQLNALNAPLEQLVNTDQGRAQLVALVNTIRDFRDLMSSEFVQLTGLNPNFNSNDGD